MEALFREFVEARADGSQPTVDELKTLMVAGNEARNCGDANVMSLFCPCATLAQHLLAGRRQ
jgi:hypothetical protein